MFVKVVRCEIREGERKDGTPFVGCSAVVLFPDKEHAARVYVSDEVIDPTEIEPGWIYDMYRDKNDSVLVFDKIREAKDNQ